MSGGGDGQVRFGTRIRTAVSRLVSNLTPQERLILAVLVVMLVAGTLTRSWRLARDPGTAVPAPEASE